MEDKNMENNYYVVENYNYTNGNIGTVEYNYLNKANVTSLIKIHYEQEIDDLKDNGYEIIESDCTDDGAWIETSDGGYFNIYCVEEVNYEDVIEKEVTIVDDELFIKQLFGDD